MQSARECAKLAEFKDAVPCESYAVSQYLRLVCAISREKGLLSSLLSSMGHHAQKHFPKLGRGSTQKVLRKHVLRGCF